MSKLRRLEEAASSREPQCSLREVLAGCVQAVQPTSESGDQLAVNADLFHRHLLRVHLESAEAAIEALFYIMTKSDPHALVWLHSLDSHVGDIPVVVLRLGHSGCLNKDTAGFRTLWSQLVSLSLELQVCALSGGREEYIIHLPASDQLEVDQVDAVSMEADRSSYPKVS